MLRSLFSSPTIPMSRCLCLVLFCVLAGSCAGRQKRNVHSPAATPRMVGRVAVVNAASGFVLVDVGSLYTPDAGSALKCFSGGEESAVLTVTPERKRPFITADIVSGAPRIGDHVFE